MALGCGILFALVLLEVGVRVTGIAPTLPLQSNYIYDPYIPYRGRAGARAKAKTAEFAYSTVFNSAGFRDDEHEINKPSGTFRILGLGDSFTFGAAVEYEDSYLRQLEKMFARRTGTHAKVEVIKRGLGGYFTESERRLLKHYGLKYQPDLVVVGFFPNDIADTAIGIEAISVSSSGYLLPHPVAWIGSIGEWLYVNLQFSRIPIRAYAAWKMDTFSPTRFKDIYKPNGFHEKDWLKVEAEFGKIAELCRSNSARLLIVHIPQIGPWDKTREYPAERLRIWSQKNKVNFVDVLPAMKKAAGQKKLYYSQNKHCTPAGYRVIAEVIFAYLNRACP